MSTKSTSFLSNLCARRISGIDVHMTDPGTVVPVDGAMCTPADLRAIFQRDLDAHHAVEHARAVLLTAIEDRKKADAERKKVDVVLKGWVQNRYGASSTEAQAFGYEPPKPRTTTVATKVVAIQKSAATRAARRTMGRAQRAMIKGTALVYVSQEAAAAAARMMPLRVLAAAPKSSATPPSG
jgi:hypothetical protein